MTNQNIDALKLNIREELNLFFKNLGFGIENYEIIFEKASLNNNKFSIYVNLIMDNPEVLIGRNGDTLEKIQHILKIILGKKIISIEYPFYLDLDINNYKERRKNYLQKIAENIAKEVILTGKEKILEIMPSYERRIVHLALKDNDKILTESVNDGRDKRVVIKLKT